VPVLIEMVDYQHNSKQGGKTTNQYMIESGRQREFENVKPKMCVSEKYYSNLEYLQRDIFLSIAVNDGFEHRLCHTKGYNICIYCFAAQHAALGSKIKEWLAQILNNLSERGDMSSLWCDTTGARTHHLPQWSHSRQQLHLRCCS
jgi:hypothetical protein